MNDVHEIRAAIEWWKKGEPLPRTVSAEQVDHIAVAMEAAEQWADILDDEQVPA